MLTYGYFPSIDHVLYQFHMLRYNTLKSTLGAVATVLSVYQRNIRVWWPLRMYRVCVSHTIVSCGRMQFMLVSRQPD